MNEYKKEIWQRVSGLILPGLGLLALAGVTLGGGALSLLGLLGLLCSENELLFSLALLLGFAVAMRGLVLIGQRFFQLQESSAAMKVNEVAATKS